MIFIVLFPSNFSNSSSVIASYFVFFSNFSKTAADPASEYDSCGQPSLLDSSGLVSLQLLPAPRQAGRACYALCILYSYSLMCALLRGRLGLLFFVWGGRCRPGTFVSTYTYLWSRLTRYKQTWSHNSLRTYVAHNTYPTLAHT